jgi:hypothetical protein
MAARKLGSWIDEYILYTQDQESPDRIHFWTALTTIAGAIGRKIWMDRNVYTLYPNLYVCIVANSAKVRKSVATAIGVGLLLDAVPSTRYIEDRMTPEGLVKQMNQMVTGANGQPTQESTVFIYEDELAALFGYDKQSASRMSTLLTGIYGCKDTYMHTTISGGQKTINKPCVTILAATAPEGLATIPPDASGGFLGRLIVVTSGQRRRNIAWPGKMDRIRRQALLDDLVQISHLTGEMTVTTNAAGVFEYWYNRQSVIAFKERWVEAFHERCHDTVLKLSMLLSISKSDSLVVDVGEIQAAIGVIEQILPELKTVGVWLTPDPLGQALARIEDLLLTSGPLKRSEVMQYVKIQASEMDEIENTMEQRGIIDIQPLGRDRLYKIRP